MAIDTATGSAGVCAWTASHATANTTRRRGRVNSSAQASSSPISIFTNVTASTGFQMTEESARSDGHDAMTSTVAIAKTHDPVAFRIPKHSTASANDCAAARPIPPAWGRLSTRGPIVTRLAHSTQ